MVLSPKAHWAFGDTACLGDTVSGKEVSLNFKNGIPEVPQQKMGAEPSQSLGRPGPHYSLHIHYHLMLCDADCCRRAEISS